MRRRFAFTIVELLVVIAIIGALVALLMPAVQLAREAARRSSCLSNLRQIGVAVSSFQSAHRKYPAGAYWSFEPTGRQKGSILIYLLPYLEERTAYEAFDFTQSNLNDAVWPGTNQMIGSTPIGVYRCPSDDHEGTFDGRALHNYAASRGPTEVYSNSDCSCTHSWNASAMAPLDDLTRFAGPFTRVGVAIGPKQIKDGLSKTIFFGEVRPTCSEHARNGWASTNNGNGYCTTLIPINYDTCNSTSADPCRRSCNWNTEVGFKSAHSGGAHFLIGDGGTHFISETIDHQTYQYLGSRDDGQSVSIEF